MYQVKQNTDNHWGIFNNETGDWHLVGKQKEHLDAVVKVLEDGLLYRSLAPALVDAIQLLIEEGNNNGKIYGQEAGIQSVHDALSQHATDCCLGDAPPLEGEHIGSVRYYKEEGDRSVGIPDYSFFELTLADGYRVVKDETPKN